MAFTVPWKLKFLLWFSRKREMRHLNEGQQNTYEKLMKRTQWCPKVPNTLWIPLHKIWSFLVSYQMHPLSLSFIPAAGNSLLTLNWRSDYFPQLMALCFWKDDFQHANWMHRKSFWCKTRALQLFLQFQNEFTAQRKT